MSRILCAYSGVEYRVDHFSLYLTSREDAHPIFSLSSQNLLELAPKYLGGEFSGTENYLYYLSLFNSTGLIQFAVPAIQTALTQSIVAQNCAHLIRMVEAIQSIGPAYARTTLSLPSFCIGPETKDLANSKYWISLWLQNLEDYNQGYKSRSLAEKLNHKEGILEKFIKDANKSVDQYANQLAEWAALAAGFSGDSSIVADGTANDRPIELREYWKKLIRMCARDEALYSIHDGDLSEIIDECEEQIDHGSIQAHLLMTVLRTAQRKKKQYADLGDIDISEAGMTFRILDPSASVEDANKQALIDAAPTKEPRITDYPNRLSYLKARMRWDLAESYRKSDEIRNAADS
jgi:hypothetical protein